MKLHTLIKNLGAACLVAPSLLHAAPTQIAQESFEGAPGAIGFTTSVAQFIETATSPLTDYFSVIPNNGTKISGNRTLLGADGPNIFAAEDCDTPRTLPAIQGPQEVTLTTNPVNIAGKINTQVRLLMAAPGRSDGTTVTLGEYENFSNAPLFINKLKVEASIDGGAFQRVVQFSPTLQDIGGQQLTFDSDGNNLGGDTNPIGTNPTTLDGTLREGIYSIPTGNTVQIRVTLESDATGELIAFDNIRIFGESAATNPPAISGVPAGNLIFTEGGSAAPIAPALAVSDMDSANLTSASVVISQGHSSTEDELSATPSGALLAGNIAYTSATGTLAITGSAPLADYQAVLRSVSYRNTNTTNPSTAARRIIFAATDGLNPSNSPTRDINIIDNITLQSIPFVESFETDGRGTRYSVDGGFSSPPSLFSRTQPGAVSGLDGTFGFGVENVDDNPDATELVTFRINGGGATGLTGELRVAAGGGAVYDNSAPTPDFLRVEVSADGGPFQNVLAFYSDTTAQGSMKQDTTPADSSNVGDGTLLTSALQTFNFNVPSGTELTVRVRAFTNIVGENILFDRLVINGPPPPTVASISSTSVNGSYKVGQVIPVTITFASAVSVTGTPQLTLETGATDRTINYTGGAGTTALTFNYTVQAGDTSANLDYISTSALTLNGGSIRSSVTSAAAVLTLPTPGASGSLGANKALVIDTVAPTFTSLTRLTPATELTSTDTLIFRATFSEVVTGVDAADFTVTGTTAAITGVSGSGSQYDITVSGGNLASLDGTVSLSLAGGQNIADAAGNALPGSAPATNETYALDNAGPTVAITSTTGNPAPDAAIPVTVTFSESVTGFDLADIAVTGGTKTNFAGTGASYIFSLTPSGPGVIVTADIAASTAQDAAGNDNTAATQFTRSIVDSVSIAATTATAVEGGATGLYTFTRAASSGPLTVSFQLDAASTATAGTDFTLTSGSTINFTPGTGAGTLVIPDGQLTATVTLTALVETPNPAEALETARLNVAAGSGYVAGASPNATVTITENSFLVTTTADSGTGSLRQAVLNANSIAGNDSITFSDGTGGTVNFTDTTADTITLTTGEITISSPLSIPGTGSSKLAVSGNNASRIFSITSVAGTVSLSDFTITAGTSSTRAGFVAFNDTLILTRVNVENCVATTTTSGGFTFNGNTLRMASCAVRNNQATTNGGGANIQVGSSALIMNCTFSGNTAGDASGGFFINRGTVINTTISGNTSNGAATGGGGVRVQATSPVSFINCTITNNSAPNVASGARSGLWADSGTVSIANSLIAGNGSQDIAKEAAATVTNAGGNLLGENTSVETEFPASSTVGTNASPINPLINALADNGGHTQTHSLLAGSPALNAGFNALIPADTFDLDSDTNTTEPLPFDQRGTGFTRAIGTVDIGAFELQKSISIFADAASADEGTGTGNTPFTFTVSRTGSISGAVTMNYAVTGSSGNPTNATDFGGTLPGGTITIPDGQTSTTLTINASHDSIREPNEDFTVTLSNPDNGFVVQTATASSAITNDDFEADVSITVTDGTTTEVPGTSITYTIVASNAGPDPATATVADAFPASLSTITWTAVGAGGGTTTASGSGDINQSANLPVGGSVTFTVSATISPAATGSLSNTATVATAGGVADTNLANNSATDTDTLTPQVDLSITKTDGVTTATPGGSVTYTITASNSGPSNVTGATVADTLPGIVSEATWTAVGAGGGTAIASGSGNINASVNLPVGGSVTYTVTAPIASSATGTLSNTATVSSVVTDPNSGNNSATDTDTLTPQADLAVTITDSPDPVNALGNLTYTVTLTSTGPSTAVSPTISLPLPASTTFVSATAPGTWNTTAPAVGGIGNVRFSNGSLGSGGSATFTVVAKVDINVVNDSTLTATATASSATTDPAPGNNSATTSTVAKSGADLQITSMDSPTPVIAGTELTYTIQVANNGPLDADNASISDVLPTGTTFVSLSVPAGWSATTPAAGTNGTVTITNSLFANAGNATFTLVVKVGSDVAKDTLLSNTAAVSSTTVDIAPGNNSATTTTTVDTRSDLAIDVISTPTTAPKGTDVSFAITLTNNGPSDASAPDISIPVPEQMTFVSATTAAGWSAITPIVGGTGSVGFSAGSLATGATASFTVVAKVNANAPNGTVLVATATAFATGVDPVPASNVDSATAAVGTVTLSAVQPITNGIGVTSQTGLFDVTITVTNTTPLPINGFRLHVDHNAYKTAYPSLRLYNASSPQGASDVYIDYPYPVAVDAVVSMRLSFYTSNRRFPSPFLPILTVEKLATSQIPQGNPEGVQPRLVMLQDQTVLLEFPSVVGKWYRVRYSPDMVHWFDCPVPLQAGTDRMQWIDSGPPFTDVPPTDAASRFYRVNEIIAP